MPSARAPKPPKYAFLKKVALALPGAVEIIDRHGHWFNIGKKTFALYGMNGNRWILRLPKEQVRMLAEADPDVFAPMISGALLWAYVDVDRLDAKALRGYMTAAWRHTAPKKLQAGMKAE
ncbi:MAG TPA: MmcQ/YjbR family DNA-binding protein [Rhizomicrobium sp.]